MTTLIEMVCSKGGTTIEAVNIYRQKGLEDIIAEGIKSLQEKIDFIERKPMKHVEIYTDGACSNNPGKGGWAAILIYKGIEKNNIGRLCKYYLTTEWSYLRLLMLSNSLKKDAALRYTATALIRWTLSLKAG